MAFIRLSDSYIDHPKFLALSASAFRLWHEGMAFCRKHQTDGAISQTALQGFRHFQPTRVKELTTVVLGEGGPLWEPVEGGYQVRNYLKWNLSREEDEKQKEGSKERTSRWRQKRFNNAISDTSRDASQDAHEPSKIRSESTNTSNDPNREASDRQRLLTTSEVAKRAAKLLETFGQLYSKHRHGARLFRSKPALDHDSACQLCIAFDDDRLRKLIEIFLTTDEDWVAKTDRSFTVFVAKAQWCEERLAAWEAKRRQA